METRVKHGARGWGEMSGLAAVAGTGGEQAAVSSPSPPQNVVGAFPTADGSLTGPLFLQISGSPDAAFHSLADDRFLIGGRR